MRKQQKQRASCTSQAVLTLSLWANMDIPQQLQNAYNEIATSYAQTRKKFWAEEKHILQHIDTNIHQRIVDLGTGSGRLIEAIKNSDTHTAPLSTQHHITWVDSAEKLLTLAEQHIKKRTHNNLVDRVCADMTTYLSNMHNNSVDIYTAIASFQHIHTKQKRHETLLHIYRSLKYDGKLIMTNRSYSHWFIKKYTPQLATSIVRSALSLWKKSRQDIYIPYHARKKYYYIYRLKELQNMLRIAWFVIEKAIYIDKTWQETTRRQDARNTLLVAKKSVYSSINIPPHLLLDESITV